MDKLDAVVQKMNSSYRILLGDLTMKNLLTAAVLTATLAFSAGAKADIIANIFDANQKEAYAQLAGASEWALVGSADFDKAKAPYDGVFTVTNLLDRYREDDQKVGNQQGTYTLDTYKGMGAGYTNALTGTDDYVGMVFSHNSANTASVALPGGLIDSFYVNVSTHADVNSTQGTFDITLTTTNGTQVFKDVAFGWAGFILEEGVYLTGFEISQNSNPNTGFTFNFVPGDGTAVTPEPASLLIFVMGLAGLGLASRRRRARDVKNDNEHGFAQ